MKGTDFLLAVVLISGIIFPVSLDEFAMQKTEPADTVEEIALQGDAAGFALIKLNGQETYVFSGSAGDVLDSSDAIKTALVQDVYARAEYQKKLDGAKTALSDFKVGKQAQEAKCNQYLGVDKKPCTDRETCVIACFAVPLCNSLINGAGFWEAMLDYNQKMTKLNAEVGEAETLLGGFEQGKIDEAVAKLDSLISTANNLSASNIFRNRTDPGCDKFDSKCFEYCPKTNYGTAGLEAAKADINGFKAVFSEVSAQDARAGAIAGKTAEEKKYLSEKGSKYSGLKISMAAKIKGISTAFEKISGNVSSQEIVDGIASLLAIENETKALGDAKNYRQALAKGAQFETAGAALDGKVSEIANKYSALKGKYQKVSEKYASAFEFVPSGSETETAYKSVSGKLSAKIGASELGSISSSIDSLDSKLNGVISEAALAGKKVKAPGSGNATATGGLPAVPSGLPCMPAFIVLFLGFSTVYFARK